MMPECQGHITPHTLPSYLEQNPNSSHGLQDPVWPGTAGLPDYIMCHLSVFFPGHSSILLPFKGLSPLPSQACDSGMFFLQSSTWMSPTLHFLVSA